MTSLQDTLNPAEVAETIFASLSEPVVILDASLRATMANEAFCAFMRMREDAVRGKSIDELIIDGPQLRTMLKRVVADGADMDATEIVCATPPNEHRVLSVSGRRLPVGPSDPILVMLELRDVTQERAAIHQYEKINRLLQRHSAELEQANRELDAFNFCIAHDLRSPLRLTGRIAHSLLNDYRDVLPESARDLVNLILAGTDEMGALTSSLLKFSQVSREPMKRKRVSMRHVVRESVAELRTQQEGRDIHFHVETLDPCRGNRAMLKQLVLNLLENAIKFTSECDHAEIRVGCTPSDSGPVYFVQDNGVGFDASDAESMFLVFRSLHRSHNIDGSGVGLAIAKRIVERHDGRIWAEGELGHGATICFTLGESFTETPELEGKV